METEEVTRLMKTSSKPIWRLTLERIKSKTPTIYCKRWISTDSGPSCTGECTPQILLDGFIQSSASLKLISRLIILLLGMWMNRNRLNSSPCPSSTSYLFSWFPNIVTFWNRQPATVTERRRNHRSKRPSLLHRLQSMEMQPKKVPRKELPILCFWHCFDH